MSHRLLVIVVTALLTAVAAPAISAQINIALINRRTPTNSHLVDVNTATKEELMSLPAVGEREAERIIKGRPYETKDQLLKAKVVPRDIYDRIERRVTTLPPPPK